MLELLLAPSWGSALIWSALAVFLVFWLFTRRRDQKQVTKRVSFYDNESASNTHREKMTSRSAQRKARAQTASSWWLSSLSCCWGDEGGIRPGKDDVDEDEVQAGTIHAKFSGLRMLEPAGQQPSCHAFSTEPVNESVYRGWELMKCTAEERNKCAELRSAIAGEVGHKDPITLLRYLRARGRNVAKAANMYKESMRWRAEDGLANGFQSGSIDDRIHRRYDDTWKLLGLLGRDHEGDAVLWERLGQARMDTCAATSGIFLVKQEIYTMVRIQQALDEVTRSERRPAMYMTVVEDLHGLGMQHFNMSALQKYKECVRVGEDYFPEIVKRVIIIRAPWIFPAIWSIAQHFFDQGTREKIQIVGARDTFKVLSKYIDKKWIPVTLGGTCQINGSPDCEPILPMGVAVPPRVQRAIQAAHPV